MANAMNTDITGRYVVIYKSSMIPEYQDLSWRVFHATGGFGCLPDTMGSAVFGRFVRDGEEARIEGLQVERFATDDEVAMAQDLDNTVRAK